jgi:DNA primase
LVVTPSKQLFYCFSAGIGGDLISFWGHIEKCSPADSGRQIADTFGVGNRGTSAPVKTSAPVHSSPSPSKPKKAEVRKDFDPQAFASKLAFTDEVAELGISEDDATRLQIGFTRGRVYFPIRNEDGSVSGFIGYADGQLKMPPQWITSNVVKLKRA